MKEKESLADFISRGGVIKKGDAPRPVEQRKHWSNKDKIDVAIGVNRKTGASESFDRFAKAFLGKGNTSWKYGK